MYVHDEIPSLTHAEVHVHDEVVDVADEAWEVGGHRRANLAEALLHGGLWERRVCVEAPGLMYTCMP